MLLKFINERQTSKTKSRKCQTVFRRFLISRCKKKYLGTPRIIVVIQLVIEASNSERVIYSTYEPKASVCYECNYSLLSRVASGIFYFN